jgi:drug/metabolite transporter (DMT)-like permease
VRWLPHCVRLLDLHHVNTDPLWRAKVVAALAIVYLMWGSTYLVIRIGVAELPPGLFAGSRLAIAGLLLIAYARWRGQAIGQAISDWRILLVTAVLMLVLANGLVVWGEQWLPSNQAALLVTTAALWIAGLGTLGPQGHALAPRILIGLTLGFVGAALLLVPAGPMLLEQFAAQLAILFAALAWASGSIYMKRVRPATPPLMFAGCQSFIAGAILCLMGVVAGEAPRWVWNPAALSALAYLIVFGSCFAFAAYIWLVHEVSPAVLGTYAYVNPLVAVVLGWWLLDEALGDLQVAGMVITLAGVLLVTLPQARRAPVDVPHT